MNNHILVVEDDPDLNNMFCRLLQLTGMPCIGAFTVSEAMQFLDGCGTPRFVVLDLELTDGNGVQVLERLSGARGSQTKVIVVSGRAYSRDDGLASYPVDHVLLKPVSPRGLSALVSSLM